MQHTQQIVPRDPSWWLCEALHAEGKDVTACPALSGEASVDIAIIGGGFTGLWTALALKRRRPDLSLAILEKDICGSGASGKNGGKVHGYWSSLPVLSGTIGDDAALAVARAGTRAQDGIRTFARECGEDIWWREAGSIRVSASSAQDAKVDCYVDEARRLGVPDMAVRLTAGEVKSYCRSSSFREGVFFPEGATIHPARLARALRKSALSLGVVIYENTPMTRLDSGNPNRIQAANGQIIAKEVVLATNASMASMADIRDHVTVFSSYAAMTEPMPEKLDKLDWSADVGLADLRMFVHYFRKTPDGRVLMGSGSGPISYGGRTDDQRLTGDKASANRAVDALKHLLPELQPFSIASVWGGAIDISSDRLPFFRTIGESRIHFGVGYSGHGVNASFIGGQCLASLVLDTKDEWRSLPFCTRTIPKLPPEPLRYIGGRMIRWGVMACEKAEDDDLEPSLTARAIAQLPKMFRLKIGTR